MDNLENSLSNIVLDTAPIKTGLEEVIGTIEGQLNKLNKILTKLGYSGIETDKKWTDLNERLELTATALAAFSKSGEHLKETGENFQDFVKTIDEITASFAGTKKIAEKLSEVLDGSDNVIREVKKDMQVNFEDVRNLRKMILAEHSAASEATDEVYKRLTAALELINNKLATTGTIRGK